MASAASRAPLSVLDLVPIAEGDDAAGALRNTLDLARSAEEFGYHRYWLAEHHLNSGLAGAAPHVLLASIAAATSRIRIGTAATLLANYRPLTVAEAIGTLAALHPGRVDLGLGRSARPSLVPIGDGEDPAPYSARLVDGVVIPDPRPVRPRGERLATQERLLAIAAPDSRDAVDDTEHFAAELGELLHLLEGTHPEVRAAGVGAPPAAGHDVDVWVHGSTAGASARAAGRLGLAFGVSYHIAPAFLLAAVEEYRASFVPSVRLREPRVVVSADVLVAADAERAVERAAGFEQWVLGIRRGLGAIEYPSPEQARALALTPAEQDAARDRLDTRFVGTPDAVVARLEALQAVSGADELVITTITHRHEHRVESYRLLAEAWVR